jgi:tRNA A64-2'-O-ribosylphosphate transferase
VDATRSATKRFPDALAKTVPIWCAVINAAVWQIAERPQDAEQSDSAGVALPPWVPPNEAAAIGARTPCWVAQLLELVPVAEVRALAPVLVAKPLRCLWLSQESPLWGLPDADALPFTPIVCVSASAPLCGHGQRQSHSSGAGSGTGFVYVPGAGDDEESWARGLTPLLFWANHARLLSAADDELQRAVEELVALHRQSLPELVTCALRAAQPVLRARATGMHDLPPQGVGHVRSGAAASLGPPDHLLRLGDATRIAVASFAALHAHGPALWGIVDAVVLLCDDAGAACAEASDLVAPVPEGALLCVRVARAQADRTSLTEALLLCAPFVKTHIDRGARVLVACPDGCERAPAALTAILALCFKEPPSATSGGGEELAAVESHEDQGLASKVLVRRWLAFVCSYHPDARPTRGLLKQAYQYLRTLDPAQVKDERAT